MPKNKQIIAFWSILAIAIITFILALVFLILGRDNYNIFVELHKIIDLSAQQENQLKSLNTSEYIYGVFLIIISILLFVFETLLANHLFNKKLK
ncbi:hypothetical protein [Mesomycoplasma bovoculi]|uniref:Uncharacterized protein n=1 Tax=Mesomycoplasma bovoculi M165/69 TaxID=743966 RepID=W5UTB3_9BACT|nr:hypothetical protein [Mesomycoplasma bovoculi]AHH45387.1 hypothetical protein MYB_01900 [Mesomycoplasma bovoculi M165/69]